MKAHWRWLLALGLLALTAIVIVFLFVSPQRSCQPRDDDPEGYLFKICTYIQEKGLDVSPADPTRYHITRIEERVEDGRPVLWIFLDCCYMGDIAIIDKETGQVIKFRPGAI